MANLLTLSRLLLRIGVVVIASQPPAAVQFISVPLMILVFVTDGLDGYIARKRHETSLNRIRRHQAEGDRVVLLSGMPDFMAEAIGRRLGLSAAVGSRCSRRRKYRPTRDSGREGRFYSVEGLVNRIVIDTIGQSHMVFTTGPESAAGRDRHMSLVQHAQGKFL
jgi:hypothetical protein